MVHETIEAFSENPESFDVGIIGGGLAGLSLSIMLSGAGHKVVLFEKETYPFHRVCGEYISLESYRFIGSLGLNLSALDLPLIKKLIVSSPNGNFITSPLDLGGIGVSRYFIDNALYQIARKNGVEVKQGAKVTDVTFQEGKFRVLFAGKKVICSQVVGSYGKKSNLDIKWSRKFIQNRPGKLNNYVGVKYHVKIGFPGDTIALHNFRDGYCGLSKIEGDIHCLCYLTNAQNLRENNNSIREMEQKVLYRNPFLEKIFSEAEFVFPEPVTISQISFDTKTQVVNHVLMTGDCAGMITPLCGNGMSMALQSSKIAFESIDLFLRKKLSRKRMEARYNAEWNEKFRARLRNGRLIQRMFGKEKVTNAFIGAIKHFPFLIKKIIKATHGSGF